MAEENKNHDYPDSVDMPAPSFWPMILAFGVTLLLTGIVTNYVVTLVGFILSVRAAVGWWRDVIPHELHEEVPVRHPADWAVPIRTTGRSVATLRVGAAHHRMRIPEKVHPYKAGLWGGIAGGIAMAILACIYGQIAHGSIWYPVNLLAATVLPSISHVNDAALNRFDLSAFGIAVLSSCDYVDSGGRSLRHDPSDVSAASALVGRIHRPAILDGADGLHSRPYQSHTERAHQLALVRHLPNRVWLGCRICRGQNSKYRYDAEPSFH